MDILIVPVQLLLEGLNAIAIFIALNLDLIQFYPDDNNTALVTILQNYHMSFKVLILLVLTGCD